MPAHSAAPPFQPMGWHAFRDLLCGIDVVYRGGDRSALQSRVVDRSFGDLTIRNVGSCGTALSGERSLERISTYREELLWVCLILVGSMRITQDRETAHLEAGDLTIVDAVRPYMFDVPEATTDSLWIGVPRSLAGHHIWDMDEVLARRIDGRSGAGMIASRVLRSAFVDTEADTADSQSTSANRIARGLMDVLAAATEGCRQQGAGSSYRNAVIRRVKNHIDAHIGDDTLTVGRIAAAQGMSPRYLAKMFEGEEQTVSGWMWERRLELCHAALGHGTGRTVSDIAYAHGYKNVSHFSRAFRDRYGVSPRSVQSTRPS